MRSRQHHEHFILKQRLKQKVSISRIRADDRKLNLSLQKCRHWMRRRGSINQHFHSWMSLLKISQHRWQPVIAGVALGADSEGTCSSGALVSDFVFRALEL